MMTGSAAKAVAEPRPAGDMIDLDALDFAKGGGTVTVVAQDSASGRVLMVAAADREALQRSLATGEMHYRSRTRGLWRKGATSGAVQRIDSLVADCDGDSVLAQVTPAGPACHTGALSCFAESAPGALRALAATIASRVEAPTPGSYTQRLLTDENLRLKKLGEECAELLTACARGDRGAAVAECADLFYHALVALAAVRGSLEDVERELGRRLAQSPRRERGEAPLATAVDDARPATVGETEGSPRAVSSAQ